MTMPICFSIRSLPLATATVICSKVWVTVCPVSMDCARAISINRPSCSPLRLSRRPRVAAWSVSVMSAVPPEAFWRAVRSAVADTPTWSATFLKAYSAFSAACAISKPAVTASLAKLASWPAMFARLTPENVSKMRRMTWPALDTLSRCRLTSCMSERNLAVSAAICTTSWPITSAIAVSVGGVAHEAAGREGRAEARFLLGARQLGPLAIEIEVVEGEGVLMRPAIDVAEDRRDQRRMAVGALVGDGRPHIEALPRREFLGRHAGHEILNGQPEVTGETKGEAPLRASPDASPTRATSAAVMTLRRIAARHRRSMAVAGCCISANSSSG